MLTEELKQFVDKYNITVVNPIESYRKEHNLPDDKWLLKVIYGDKAMKDGVWETINFYSHAPRGARHAGLYVQPAPRYFYSHAPRGARR
jgi:hypothetical protein